MNLHPVNFVSRIMAIQASFPCSCRNREFQVSKARSISLIFTDSLLTSMALSESLRFSWSLSADVITMGWNCDFCNGMRPANAEGIYFTT